MKKNERFFSLFSIHKQKLYILGILNFYYTYIYINNITENQCYKGYKNAKSVIKNRGKSL